MCGIFIVASTALIVNLKYRYTEFYQKNRCAIWMSMLVVNVPLEIRAFSDWYLSVHLTELRKLLKN